MRLKQLMSWFGVFAVMPASALEIGEALPALKGLGHEGKEIEIKMEENHSWLLIFSFPKASTPG